VSAHRWIQLDMHTPADSRYNQTTGVWPSQNIVTDHCQVNVRGTGGLFCYSTHTITPRITGRKARELIRLLMWPLSPRRVTSDCDEASPLKWNSNTAHPVEPHVRRHGQQTRPEQPKRREQVPATRASKDGMKSDTSTT